MHVNKTYLAASLLLSSHAFALDQCQPSKEEPRIRICQYSPTQIYLITGIVEEPTNLVFSSNETIKRLDWSYKKISATEATATWSGPKLKGDGKGEDKNTGIDPSAFANNLPLWPHEKGLSRVIIITSTANEEERSYQFQLVAREREPDCESIPNGAGCSGDINTTIGIQFTYSGKDAPRPATTSQPSSPPQQVAWKTKAAKDTELIAKERMKVDPYYGTQNSQYSAHGSLKYAQLAPKRIWDNGIITAMIWPGNVEPPSISIIDCENPKEREVMIPQTRPDGLVILPAVKPCWRLTAGKDGVLDIFNNAWSAERPMTGTGTTNSGVVARVLPPERNK